MMAASLFKTTTNYGMTVSAEDKINYYKAIIMEKLKEKPTPKTLNEAVKTLIDVAPDDVIAQVKSGEVDPAGAGHFGIGMWIRNNWGLWSGSELQEWFHGKGIRHADDMSGIILETFRREIQGEDWELEEQIDNYREYWLDKGVDPDKIGLDEDE